MESTSECHALECNVYSQIDNDSFFWQRKSTTFGVFSQQILMAILIHYIFKGKIIKKKMSVRYSI